MTVDKPEHKEFLLKFIDAAAKHVPIHAQSWPLAAEVLEAIAKAQIKGNDE